MIAALLVALIGLIGSIGAALLVRVSHVKTSVNGRMTQLLDMIEERDQVIRRLLSEGKDPDGEPHTPGNN